jgi:hypothetical protein
MGRLEESKRGIFWLILVFTPLIILLGYQIFKRNQELQDFEIACGEVYIVHLNQRKGITTNKNVALYRYSFEGVEYDKSSEFYTFDVKVGDTFKIKVSRENPETHDIDFSEKYSDCNEILSAQVRVPTNQPKRTGKSK